MDEEYLKRIRGLTFLSSEDIDIRMNSNLYKVHPVFPIIVKEDGTEIIDIRDGAILPIRNRKNTHSNRPNIRVRDFKGRRALSIIIYEAWNNEILEEGFSIHHDDENRFNNHYSNLVKMDHDLHNLLHKTRARQKAKTLV